MVADVPAGKFAGVNYMALSETNQIQLSMILNQSLLDIQLQLNYLGARFTTAVQTQIETLITTWNAGAGSKFTKLHPTESNKGVETRPDAVRSNLQTEIAILLERADWGSGGGSVMTSHVMRG